jgi:hypothetical protein
MAQQTALEWLINEWPILESNIPPRIIEQAKAMEKEQIIKACESHADYPFEYIDFIDYYNETYGNDTKGKI